MTRGHLSGQQLFWLAFTAMFPTIILLLPGDLLRIGHRHAWLTPLVVGIPTCAYSWILGAWAGRRGDLVRALLRGLGPIGGRVLLTAAWAGVGIYTVIAVRESVDLAAQAFILREVAVPALDILGLGPALVFAVLGPVAMARVATILSGIGLVAYLGSVIAAVATAHPIWARPLLPHTLAFARPHALDLMAVWLFEPALVGTVLMRRVAAAERVHAGRILAGAVALAAVLSSAGMWAMTASMGPVLAATMVDPYVSLIHGIDVSSVQHLDTLILPLMIISSALKLGIFFSIWTELSAGMASRRWARPALLLQLVGAGLVGITLIGSPQAADRALYTWAGLRALPALAGTVLLAYGILGLRRPGKRA